MPLPDSMVNVPLMTMVVWCVPSSSSVDYCPSDSPTLAVQVDS